MFSLQSLLATDVMKIVSWGIGGFALAVVLIALIIGFTKGFRRIGWGGFFWVIVAAAFILLNKFLQDDNPLNSAFEDMAGVESVAFLSTCSIAAVSVLGALLIYGIVSAIFRPKMKWVKDDSVEYDEYGFEYEADDYTDDYDDSRVHGKRLKKSGYGKVGLFNRLIGALVCAVNAAAVMAVVLGVVGVILNGTGLGNGKVGELLVFPASKTIIPFFQKYLFDFLFVGIVFGVAYFGFNKGFAESFRIVFVKIGTVVVIVGSFALPFLEISSEWGLYGRYVDKCLALFDGLKSPFDSVCGGVLAGLLMAIACGVILFILNIAMKKWADLVYDVKILKIPDGILACVIFTAVGIALGALALALAYVIDWADLVNVKAMFENSALVNGAFEFFDEHLLPILDKYLLQYV